MKDSDKDLLNKHGERWIKEFTSTVGDIIHQKFDQHGTVQPCFIMAISNDEHLMSSQLGKHAKKVEHREAKHQDASGWGMAIAPIPESLMGSDRSKDELLGAMIEMMKDAKPFAVAFISEAWKSVKNKKDGDRISKEGYSKNGDKPSEDPNREEIIMARIETVMDQQINPIWKIIRPGNDPKATGILMEDNQDAKLLDITIADPELKIAGRFANFYEKLKKGKIGFNNFHISEESSKEDDQKKKDKLKDLLKNLNL